MLRVEKITPLRNGASAERRHLTLMKQLEKSLPPALAIILMSTSTLLNGCLHGHPKRSGQALAYPVTARTNQVDDYHGTLVADPYRWLEDDNSDATRAWVEAENKVTFSFLDQISERAAISN